MILYLSLICKQCVYCRTKTAAKKVGSWVILTTVIVVGISTGLIFLAQALADDNSKESTKHNDNNDVTTRAPSLETIPFY